MKSNMNFLTKSVYILPKASLQQSLEAVVVKQMLKLLSTTVSTLHFILLEA